MHAAQLRPLSLSHDSSDISQIWDLYFPGQSYCNEDLRKSLISKLASFFGAEEGQNFLSYMKQHEEGYVAMVDYTNLRNALNDQSFESGIAHEPQEVLTCIGAAMHQVLFNLSTREAGSVGASLSKPGKITVRLVNFPESRVRMHWIGLVCGASRCELLTFWHVQRCTSGS